MNFFNYIKAYQNFHDLIFQVSPLQSEPKAGHLFATFLHKAISDVFDDVESQNRLVSLLAEYLKDDDIVTEKEAFETEVEEQNFTGITLKNSSEFTNDQVEEQNFTEITLKNSSEFTHDQVEEQNFTEITLKNSSEFTHKQVEEQNVTEITLKSSAEFTHDQKMRFDAPVTDTINDLEEYTTQYLEMNVNVPPESEEITSMSHQVDETEIENGAIDMHSIVRYPTEETDGEEYEADESVLDEEQMIEEKEKVDNDENVVKNLDEIVEEMIKENVEEEEEQEKDANRKTNKGFSDMLEDSGDDKMWYKDAEFINYFNSHHKNQWDVKPKAPYRYNEIGRDRHEQVNFFTFFTRRS